MEELVSLNRIASQVEASDWQEAIAQAGKLLEINEDIDHRYIDDMINSVKELGPYIVLTKGFALAHSAPCEAVKKTGISLVNLKEPVDFGSNNDPVKVVMCLACTDKKSHMELLQKVANKLMKKGTIDKLSGCKEDMDLYLAINN